MNLVTQTLPLVYQQDAEQLEIADALTQGIAEKYSYWIDIIANYETKFLDPETAEEEWLDTLSRWSGWGNYWDSSWSVEIKRKLLKNTDFIWRNRGNKELLPLLFNIFNLNAQLIPQSGIILGVSTLPGTFTNDPFSYQISVPSNYIPGSYEYILIQRLLKQFTPCWYQIDIVNS